MVIRFLPALSAAFMPPARAIRRGVRQPGLLFCVLGIAMLWTVVLYLLSVERQQAVDSALDNTANVARAYQEQISGVMRALDQTLRYVRASYSREPDRYRVVWPQNSEFLTDSVIQISIIGKDGYLRCSSVEPVTSPVYLGDREHFRVQAEATSDTMFISKPVVGRVTGAWSIQLTRRITGPDGAFVGVVVVSVDPFELSRFFDSLNLGSQGTIVLVGTDGIIRARAPIGQETIGQSLIGGQLMRSFAQKPSGNFLTSGKMDGITRIYGYRAVEGYPLLVTVGISVQDALAGYYRDRRTYLTVAGAVSVLLLVVTVLIVRHRIHLDLAREALHASETRNAEKSRLLEATLENMSQGILMLDGSFTVQVYNRRIVELFGLPGTLMAARPHINEVLRFLWQRGEFSDASTDFDTFIADFIARRRGQYYVLEHPRPDGTILEVRSTPLPNGGIVRTYTDVTERNRAEDALRATRDEATRAAQAKSEFLAVMSHEIRTPLSGLLGIVELLRDTGLKPEQREMIELMHGSGTSLLRVLNDVLDFSKIDAGVVELELEPTELRQFVSALIGSLRPNASAKGLSLAADVASLLPAWISTDPARLRQIMANLLGNAIKFTSLGSVRLAVTGTMLPEGGHSLAFAVSDTGIGIAPEVVGRLFEPFIQADASTTRTFGGTGLGLSISRRLARLLGGDITVTSALGRGSVFTLSVPLVPVHDSIPAAVREQSSHDAALASLRVLVAEDQATNRWVLERQLKRLECSVTAVEDGGAALAALNAAEYDLLITDCHMPEIDGVILTRLIRVAEAARGARRLPILGLTADITAEMHERCAAAGMDEVVAKPIDLRRLRAAIARLVHDVGAESVAPDRNPDGAVFDPAKWCEAFTDRGAGAREWLGAYLVEAPELLAGVAQSAADGDRGALAAHAHALACSSLAVGAMRLGTLGHQLEADAPCAPEPELRRSAEALAAAWREARDAIGQHVAIVESVS